MEARFRRQTAMNTSTHPAIDMLCGLLSSVPKQRRDDAIIFACIAVGRPAERTGLDPIGSRTIHQLFWDLTTDDLRQRLVYLIEEVGVLEQTVVQGVIGFLDSHFSAQASREFSERARDNQISRIAHLEQQLGLPVDERTRPISDLQLQDLVDKSKQWLAETEQRRREAEETLHFLRNHVEEVFTEELWDTLTARETEGLGGPSSDWDRDG